MKSKWIAAALALGIVSAQGIAAQPVFAAQGWQQNAEQKWEYYGEDEKLVKSQWIEDGGRKYYVDAKGIMQQNVSVAIDKVYYAFGADGHLLAGGWVSITIPPKDEKSKPTITWYYAGEGGALLTDGWHEVKGGGLFYFNKNGSCTRSGVVKVGNDRFFIDEKQGRLGSTPGWFKGETVNYAAETSSVNWYYAKEDGSLLCSSWLEENGSWYYLQANGNRAHNGSAAVDGSYYAFDGEGRMLSGGWVSTQASRTDPTKKAATTWYYAGADGKLLTDGWHTVEGEELYFAKNGACTRNGAVKVGDDKFYVDEATGKRGNEQGWFSVDVTGTNGSVTTYWYYAKEDSSILYGGWFPVDGHTVYFDANGRAQLNKWFKIGEEWVCVNKDGDRLGPGWVSLDLVDSKGNPYTNWYYVNGDMTRAENGFRQMDGVWYYFDKNGVNYRAKWYVDPEKNRYYLDENGAMKENGWFSIDTVSKNKAGEDVTTTRWYYAGPDGSCLKSGDHMLDGKTYYFSDAGVNLRKAFRKEGNRRKYYGEDGAQKKGEWFSITSTSTITGPATMEMELEEITTEKETWYYADAEGWVQGRSHSMEIDGNEYKFNKNGVLLTDWQKDGEGEYYFYGKDGAKVTGWIEYEMPTSWLATEAYNNYATLFGRKAWFYLDPANGGKAVCAQNQSYSEVMIGGHYYAVNARGMVWLGWCKTQRNKKDDMRRYHYYMPQAENGLVQGERAAGCAVLTAPPAEMGQGTEPAWFYFDFQGDVLRSDSAGSFEKVHLGDGSYVLVDFYGISQKGLAFKGTDKVRVRDVYYFDPDNQNKMATGTKEVTLPDGRKEWYAFGADGIGLTGEVNGYLYYKGRLQTGTGIRAVTVVKNEGSELADVTNRYLVDGSGKILKNAEGVQGEGGTFSSNATGIATAVNGTSERAQGPAEADFTAYIGDNEKD